MKTVAVPSPRSYRSLPSASLGLSSGHRRATAPVTADLGLDDISSRRLAYSGLSAFFAKFAPTSESKTTDLGSV